MQPYQFWPQGDDQNYFNDPNEAGEHIVERVNCLDFRIELIYSNGHATEIYEQAEDEYVQLLTGSAKLSIETTSGAMEILSLEAGDGIFIPAGCRHQVLTTASQTRWLCCFSAPRNKVD
ncbi:MAG: hypothetical protein Q4P72_00745 [Eubacteriales bacterium]|nr:hypothetical protein [Eubacteriales bacterium]